MEEKILKELKNINLQLQAFDSKIDEKLKVQKEEICSELRQEFKEDLNTVRQEFKEDLNTVSQEFEKHLNAKSQEFEEKFDSKLENLKTFIISDVSKAFREHIDVIYDRKNKEHHEIVEELREHKVRTLKGVRAFERALTV